MRLVLFPLQSSWTLSAGKEDSLGCLASVFCLFKACIESQAPGAGEGGALRLELGSLEQQGTCSGGESTAVLNDKLQGRLMGSFPGQDLSISYPLLLPF